MIEFEVSAPNPHDHLFHVKMRLDVSAEEGRLVLHMPVWSPGSYLVREYPRHVQNVRAHVADSRAPLRVRQQDKSSWEVLTNGADAIVVAYEVFSHELAVRTNHLDDTHGSFNGVATFMYPEGRLDEEVEVTFGELPDAWEAFGGLTQLDQDRQRWRADDFDMLFDSPMELGSYDPLTFEVEGIPHDIILWGEGNYDPERLREDMKKCVEGHAAMFGGLPYDHYTFIIHLTDKGRGGLEHHNSTILLYPRDGFRDGPPGSELKDDGTPTDTYLNFLRLVSHEHFHVWNVKRIRPAVLGPFDYQHENYTRDLWTVEGITSYYETVGLMRADVLDGERFLGIVADAAKSLSEVPGRLVHSLEDASLNAWVKLYRPDESTKNTSVSYYLKGELVCFLLDAKIRAETGGEKSLDDVLLLLWSHYRETGEGYAEESYGEWVERATGVDVEAFLDRHVRSAEAIDWEESLASVGLGLTTKKSKKSTHSGWFGADTKIVKGRIRIRRTPTAGPAQIAGIYAEDEIVAIDGRQVTSKNFKKTLKRYAPGASVTVHLFRRGMLLEREVVLGERPDDTWSIEVHDDATPEQRELLSAWLGLDTDG